MANESKEDKGNKSQWTCLSCTVAFQTSTAQRVHHQSEWHRYNLRRRVAGLSPLPLEEFNSRQAAANQAPPEPTHCFCKPCNKHFNTNNSYTNHLNSKKHKMAEENYKDNDDDKESAPEIVSENKTKEQETSSNESSFEEINDIFPNDCLFCDHHSKTIVKNISHMAVVHSFFIPDAEYCTDIKGFLEYLGEKISQGYMCLWCNDKGRAFYSLEAAQAHMRDKGHCKVLHEGAVLAEYADFYDYSSSYPDHVEGDEDMEIDFEENVLEPTKTDNEEEYELVLPSGFVIGHRSLLRYYKQNLTSYTGALVKKNNEKLRRVINQYKSIGWAPQQNEIIAKKAKDIQYMRRVQMKWQTKLSVKANKLQKHFRPQCNF